MTSGDKKFLGLCAGLGACVGGLFGYFMYLSTNTKGVAVLQWMNYRTDEFLVWAAIGAGIAVLIAQLWKRASKED